VEGRDSTPAKALQHEAGSMIVQRLMAGGDQKQNTTKRECSFGDRGDGSEQGSERSSVPVLPVLQRLLGYKQTEEKSTRRAFSLQGNSQEKKLQKKPTKKKNHVLVFIFCRGRLNESKGGTEQKLTNRNMYQRKV